jgi:hypothetical protein
MIVENTDNLECTLPALEDVVPDLTDRYMLSLKSGANRDEVLHWLKFCGMRLLAYQIGTYYEFIPEFKESNFSTDIEDFVDHENRINNTTESFSRFNFHFKGDFINEFKEKNKGVEKLENLDWVFSTTFVNCFGLPKVGFANTEDLSFNIPECDFYGRSMIRLFQQEYVRLHPEMFKRNFEVIKLDDPRFSNDGAELIKKMRNLSLSREESVKLLKNIKCHKSGRTLDVILDKDFTLVG